MLCVEVVSVVLVLLVVVLRGRWVGFGGTRVVFDLVLGTLNVLKLNIACCEVEVLVLFGVIVSMRLIEDGGLMSGLRLLAVTGDGVMPLPAVLTEFGVLRLVVVLRDAGVLVLPSPLTEFKVAAIFRVLVRFRDIGVLCLLVALRLVGVLRVIGEVSLVREVLFMNAVDA